jgi:hypothetical protein
LAAVGRFDAFTTQQMRRIFMSMRRLRAGLSGLAIMLVPLSESLAHEIVGNRFNRQSGTNVGVIAQPHFYLDDIDPRGIGRPIFGNAPPPATPFGGN